MSKIFNGVWVLVVVAGGFSTAAMADNIDKVRMQNSYRCSKAEECAGKGAELEMINLQQMVSQRQMAVQLTTRILSKLGGCEICANIK
jgi:hypothetical protein